MAGPSQECALCPRLAEYRGSIRPKNPLFSTYWNKPVPDFGDPDAWLLIVGLAPGAHGANRTGRPFTGDSAGVLLYRALYDAGLSDTRDVLDYVPDIRLSGVLITNAVHCAPPDNKPSPEEFRNCQPFLSALLDEPSFTDILCLGASAHRMVCRTLGVRGEGFGHGKSFAAGRFRVYSSYHTSRYNSNVGRITAGQVTEILTRIRQAAGR